MAPSGGLSSRPPSLSSPDPDAVAAFIDGAAMQTQTDAMAVPVAPTRPEPAAPPLYPWQAPGVRDDVTKVYNLRLPEPYLLKLKYIAEHVPESMQQFCLNMLLPAIDEKIADLTGAPPTRPNSR